MLKGREVALNYMIRSLIALIISNLVSCIQDFRIPSAASSFCLCFLRNFRKKVVASAYVARAKSPN
ncbi:hypothetical protein MKX01_021048, partial [Papaver californicum]